MGKIDTINLCSRKPDRQIAFYRDILGMSLNAADGVLSYDPREAGLKFVNTDTGYTPSKADLYWKISIAVPDIELACRQLIENGVAIEDPRQFRDVGYLAHFRDPEGYPVELIDHCFKGNRTGRPADKHRLGGGAHLNLLTLRSTDIERDRSDLRAHGVTLVCVQPVLDYGFTLYFFAFTNDEPPDCELTSVVNREWVYQRPYTLLELQYLHNTDTALLPIDQQTGFQGATVCGVDPSWGVPQLRLSTVATNNCR